MSKIHHQIHSPDNNKPWVLLIHGLFGNVDNLSGLRRLLSSDFQVLSVDLPDHGKSEYTDSFSFYQYAQRIEQLLVKLQIENIAIVGHSLGGKVAMQFALNHPRFVSHIIVLDIAPVEYAPRHDNVIQGLNSINLATLENRQQANLQLQKYVTELSTRQFLLKGLYQDNQQWKWRFNLALLQRDYLKLSKAITADSKFEKPVLFIKGGNSDYLLIEHRPHILKLFPNSQSKMVGNTGHWLHAEKPELCHKLITTFISAN